MVGSKVNTDLLVKAGLSLMEQAGKRMERVEPKGRRGPAPQIYRTPDGRTVRVRTCNDHVLMVKADHEDPDRAIHLNCDGADDLLIVMPERPRTPGPVTAYLVPTDVASKAVRDGHRSWLATGPNTKGDNRTWRVNFDDRGVTPEGSNFNEKWKGYRLGGAVSAGAMSVTPPTPKAEISSKVGEMVVLVRGVPVRVTVSIDA